MNILDLLKEDGFEPQEVTSSGKVEYSSPCPFCGGKDRFRIWPRQNKGKGRYWCRKCGNTGKAIDYLMDKKGYEHNEACKILKIKPAKSSSSKIVSTDKEIWKAKDDEKVIPVQWQQNAKQFLINSIKALWSNRFVIKRRQLHKRGIKDETIKKFRLGWNETDIYGIRTKWGLKEIIKENGMKKKLWIPGGLVIPTFDEAGKICRIRVRRSNPNDNFGRYVVLSGSSMKPMVIGNKKIFAIVESELDAMLLHQEAGDYLSVMALGSVHYKPDENMTERLRKAPLILVCLDNDEAGARVTENFWIKQFKNAKKWPVVNGKDPSDAYSNGVNIRDWILSGV